MTAQAPQSTARRSTATRAQYVYGVMRADSGVPRAAGIARRRLHAIREDGLSALVSDAPDGEILGRRDELMTHARVLERAFENATVLPMRFGVVMPDEEAVRVELLDAYRDELLLQLRDLDGTAELRLRAFYEEDAVMREILETNSDIAGLSAAVRDKPAEAVHYEQIELGRKVAQALEQVAAVDLAAILDALEPLAVAVQVGEPEHERVAANVSFLVKRAAIAPFDEAVDDLGRRNAGRLTFKYTGPLPPYSFVELPARG